MSDIKVIGTYTDKKYFLTVCKEEDVKKDNWFEEINRLTKGIPYAYRYHTIYRFDKYYKIEVSKCFYFSISKENFGKLVATELNEDILILLQDFRITENETIIFTVVPKDHIVIETKRNYKQRKEEETLRQNTDKNKVLKSLFCPNLTDLLTKFNLRTIENYGNELIIQFGAKPAFAEYVIKEVFDKRFKEIGLECKPEFSKFYNSLIYNLTKAKIIEKE